MKNVFIYTLTDPITNLVRYVGKTCNLDNRFRHHLVSTANIKTHKRNWINSLKERGVIPIINIIDIVPEDNWQFWEQYWICQLKCWGFNLVNHTLGGDGLTSSNDSSFKKGLIPWNKGKQIRLKPKKNVHQYSALTGDYIKTWSTAKEASIALNINEESIGRSARGDSLAAGGYLWTYYKLEKEMPLVYEGKTNNKLKNNLK